MQVSRSQRTRPPAGTNGASALTLPLHSAESILIHYIKSNNVVVLVVAEDSAGRRMPFSFLAELMKRVSRQLALSSYALHC